MFVFSLSLNPASLMLSFLVAQDPNCTITSEAINISPNLKM